MGISGAVYIYVIFEVVLMYFIKEGRINADEGKIQPSNWSGSSEKEVQGNGYFVRISRHKVLRLQSMPGRDTLFAYYRFKL
jgi:hypothetical protein